MIEATRNIRGDWQCENNFDLSNGRYIQILTMRRSDGALQTTVNGFQAMSTRGLSSTSPFSDFRIWPFTSRPNRISSKLVVEQHAKALALKDEYLQQAEKFYASSQTNSDSSKS